MEIWRFSCGRKVRTWDAFLVIFLKKWFFIWNRGLRPSMDRKSLQESEFHCKNTRGAPYDLEIWKIMKNITRHPRLHMNTPGPNDKIFPDRWIEYMDVSGPHPAPRFVWRAPKENDSLSSARRVIYPTGGNLAVYWLQKIGNFSFWKSILLEFCTIRKDWVPIYIFNHIIQ